MSDCIWYALDDALENGEPIDPIIPYDCVGMSEMEYIQILAVLETYSNIPARREMARKKLMKYESRGNSIL